MLEHYYEVISRIVPDVTFVAAPRALRRKKYEHKYGPAPYHFIGEYNMTIARSIRDLVSERTARSKRRRAPRGGAARGRAPARRSRSRETPVHYLSATAVLLLGFCAGRVKASELPALLQAAYQLPKAPVGEVARCLDEFFKEGLVHCPRSARAFRRIRAT